MEPTNNAICLLREAVFPESDYSYFSPNTPFDSILRLTQSLGHLLEEVSHG